MSNDIKLVLILMIKNEELILERCLNSVRGLVDGYFITDTGSTDNSVNIAKEYLKDKKGCVFQTEWKNFGKNRSESFSLAKEFIQNNYDWKLDKTFGLLLDGDMKFITVKFDKNNLKHPGYKIKQRNGNLIYYNVRFLRFDCDWSCIGVTHEYWDAKYVTTNNLDDDICYIDDIDDGGCKDDKYERDIKLLKDGLIKEQGNVRYLFYLAQSYKCIGDYKNAIMYYKMRIKGGGWFEEVWYSYYMIGECYLKLKDVINFEKWMLKAYEHNKYRAEPLYKLAKYFREKSEYYKAYHYILLGLKIKFPDNQVLFIENDVYSGLFIYEQSIVEFYVSHNLDKVLQISMKSLLECPYYHDNVISNLKFSVKSFCSKFTEIKLPAPFGPHFNPSAISLHEYPYANVRYHNYGIDKKGNYSSNDGGPISTKNCYVNLEDCEDYKAFQIEPTKPHISNIQGFEDLRLYKYNNKDYFTAVSNREYSSDKIQIVKGLYNLDTLTYDDIEVMVSPTNSTCEKNWISLDCENTFVYKWHPLTIGTIIEDRFEITDKIDTPPFFKNIRGSTPPVVVDGTYWVLVHFVECASPRKYYHAFVNLDKTNHRPIRVSLPFYFKSNEIEYCISGRLLDAKTLEYFVSSWDKNPFRATINVNDVKWINL